MLLCGGVEPQVRRRNLSVPSSSGKMLLSAAAVAIAASSSTFSPLLIGEDAAVPEAPLATLAISVLSVPSSSGKMLLSW